MEEGKAHILAANRLLRHVDGSEHPTDPLSGGKTKYETLHRIGGALFGFTLLARDKQTQEEVVIRFFDPRLPKGQWIPLEDWDCLKSLAQQMQLRHPCILDVKEAIACPPYLGLVMEVAPDGDVAMLAVQQGGLSEAEARPLFQQLILAMDYCHEKGATCKDVRLEHTFLARQAGGGPPKLKMRQFDYTALLMDLLGASARTAASRPTYLAPEVLHCLDGYDEVTADAWAAGCMLYSMLFARPPFMRPEDGLLNVAARVHAVLQRVDKVQYDFPASHPISEECRDLIQRLLVRNPTERLPFTAIKEHPWFKKDLAPSLLEHHRQAVQQPTKPAQTAEQLREIVDQVVSANAKAARASEA